MTHIIAHLLKTIHSKWLYRNEVVHKRTADGRKHVGGKNIRISIRSQLRKGPGGLDVQDKFLLNHSEREINIWSGGNKNLRLYAIKAARLAS